MTVDWTLEMIWATFILLGVFALSAYWAGSIKKILFLLIGFIGVFLAIIQPFQLREKSFETTVVSNVQEFLASEEMNWTDTVKLEGNNHKIEDVQLLKDYPIVLEDFIIPNGFSDLRIPEIIEGEKFTIHGTFKNENGAFPEIWLERANGERIEASNLESEFSIDVTAPTKGLYEYTLNAALSSKDTITEILPVQVKPSSKMTMLILANSPQFDLNYLKNYWVDQGHSLVQKVKISQEKYSTNYINIPEFKFSSLTEKVLDRFDIVFMDMETWNSISSRERNLVVEAVKDKGLGLGIKPTKTGLSAKGLPYHKVLRYYNEEIDNANLEMVDIEHNRSWKLLDFGAIWQHGYGNVFLLKVSDSYQLILHDKARTYNQMWAGILSTLFTKKADGFTLQTPFLAFEDERISGQVGFLGQEDKLLLNDGFPVIVNFTPLLEAYGEIELMDRRGWNKVSKLDSDEVQWFYAFPNGSWETMRAMQLETYLEFMQQNKDNGALKPYEEKEKFPWWIAILMISLGFGVVWFMEKMG